jgi:hypothetical protein
MLPRPTQIAPTSVLFWLVMQHPTKGSPQYLFGYRPRQGSHSFPSSFLLTLLSKLMLCGMELSRSHGWFRCPHPDTHPDPVSQPDVHLQKEAEVIQAPAQC